MKRYNPKEIEPKWQEIWDQSGTYTADLTSDKPKYIAMSMFNYPSGAGIHIGHAMNYTISDVKARFKRQQGYESYHPVGWDAFGLPAENYAIKAGVSPQESMAKIIPGYHKQYKAMGWSNDWEKEIATHLPEYYRWTQWIFWKMHEQGLAYQDSRMQWYCEIDNTVLANEQVIDGKCWRHDGPDDPLVQKKEVKQWFFKITEYADELLEAIDDLDWTETVKLAQRNWIGKSSGAEISFKLDGLDKAVTVFTTRPDTIYGATFLVLAPEHELVSEITTAKQRRAVGAYVKEAQKKSEVDRQAAKEKTGVFTGAYAVNPASGDKIPVWVADYVLVGYGTGAIMAVPAHDERDYAFAQAVSLPVVPVIAPEFFWNGTGAAHRGKAIDRPAVLAVTHDPATDRYCLIDWGEHEWRGLEWPGGGVEAGETVEAAALREFTEETGYTNVVVEAVTPINGLAYYYGRDGSVRRNMFQVALLRLQSDANNGTVGTEDYEKEAYRVEWVTRAELVRRSADMEDIYAAATEFVLNGTVHSSKEGVLINSGPYTKLEASEARENIVKTLAEQGMANEKVNYRMRDWSVSRQRYWGAPIPVINCPKCGPVSVPENELPVLLPELNDFKPSGDGRSALARATDWLHVSCPQCGGPAERETDTLDTYICSSWYFLRYFDPHNQQQAFDTSVVNKWMPIDFYNGGDHATAHMLYARFVTRFFYKLGLVNNPEPFKQFLFNGKVTAGDGTMFSKSKGNGVDPLDIIEQGYGADALRTYLMFAAPLELWIRWDPQGVPGAHRFLSRIWNLVQEYLEASEGTLDAGTERELRRVTHGMIKKMTEDIEANHYNTAIAAAMGTVNELYRLKARQLSKSPAWQETLEAVTACVAPFAPHIADELWLQLGHHNSVQRDSWPAWDGTYLAQGTVTLAVQVNGKLRGDITVPADVTEQEAVKAAQANDKVRPHLAGKTVSKVIYVPGRIINLVLSA